MKSLRKRLAPAFLALVLCLSLTPAALAETVSTTVAGDSVILEGELSDVVVSGGGTIVGAPDRGGSTGTVVTVTPGQEVATVTPNPGSGDAVVSGGGTVTVAPGGVTILDPDTSGGEYITVPVTPAPTPDPDDIYEGVANVSIRPESCYITFFVRPGLFYDVYKTSVTIEAKWSGSGYRLTSLPSDPKWDGYLFGGWWLDGKAIDDIASYDFQGNATVTPKWVSVIPSYSITFDPNGGRFTLSEVPIVVKTNLIDGKQHVFTPNNPTRSGYAFYKWDPIEDPSDYDFTEDTTLTALWGYPISFVMQDSRQTWENTFATAPNGKLDSLPAPSAYYNHVFLGWSTSETSDSPEFIIDKDHVFTGAAKLYPKWALSDNLTVTLNPNGGSVSPTSIKIGSDGKLVSALPTPTRSGYTFAGWFVGTEQIKQDNVYSGPAALTARWTRSSKISPTVTVSPSSVKSGSNKVEITLSCSAAEAALDWRPLERIVTASSANLETAVKNYISGNFSAAGLKLTGVKYADACDCNYNAYFQSAYPEGVFPVRKLILTFEGAAKAGTMKIELGSGIFAALAAKGVTVDQSSADLFNPASVSVLIGDSVAAQTGQNTPAATVSFTDVAPTSPFASAISWAVQNQITNGTGDGTTFSPSVTCTRAHILTFLWRSQGSPEPTIANPYKDTIPAAFQKAAIWAYEKGLVSGTEFGAATPCTRESSVTYMWKLAGSPKAKTSSFKDVAAGAAYAQAIDWAVEQGVTNGTGDGSTFSPSTTCTRGQIVTFLFRAYAEKS